MASASQSFSFRIHDPKQIYAKLSQALGLSPSSRRAPLNIPYHLQSDWFLCIFEAVQYVSQALGLSPSSRRAPLNIPYHLQSDWFLCLFEAVQNAFQHGSKDKQPVRV